MAETMLQLLRTYFDNCPFFTNGRLEAECLPDGAFACSVDAAPASNVLEAYIDGSSLRDYFFYLRSESEYPKATLQQIANCGVSERVAEWMEAQSAQGHLPVLPAGKVPVGLQVQDTIFLSKPASQEQGVYQIQCRLIYEQKG